MLRLLPSVLLLIGFAALSAEAQTALLPVEPKVSCASLRGYVPPQIRFEVRLPLLTSVDVLTPLMQWVEGGRAPDALVASRADANASAGKGRTLYAFPTTSVLRAGGDAENPASWQPGPPVQVPAKL